MAGATTVTFVYNIAVTQALRWSRRRLGKGSEFEICSEKSHPRLLASSLLQAALLFGGGFLFEYLYTKSAVLPTTVSGIAWAMRRCVGLPGKAPYGELSGGGPVANVLTTICVLEHAHRQLPIPTVGCLGINVVPLTSEQAIEIFLPLSGNLEGHIELRFITPTRLVRIACQVGFAYAVVGLVRRYLVPKLVGSSNRLRQPTSLPTYLTIPATVVGALALVRDAESISLPGTCLRLNLVDTSFLLLIPTYMLLEISINSLRLCPNFPPSEMVSLFEQIRQETLSGLPVQFMSKQDTSLVKKLLFRSLLCAIYSGDSAAFAGVLSALTTVLVTLNEAPHTESLAAYESSLERINAGLADEVLERQASIESAADETITDMCSICLGAERPTSQDMLRVKACGHVFHTNCLVSWLSQATQCPLCRIDIERQIPISDQRYLQLWLDTPEERKEAFLRAHCINAANFVADALCIGPVDSTKESRFTVLYMLSVGELLSTVSLGQFLHLDRKTTLLFMSMSEYAYGVQREFSSPFFYNLGVLACLLVAPCSPSPLFSVGFISKSNIESLEATNYPQCLARRVLLWMHFFSY